MKSPLSRLSAYSAAATAALASARAEVVYSGPENISVASGFSYSVDLNNDGQADITLQNYVFGGVPYEGALVNFAPGKIVGFRAGPGNYAYVSNLSAGFLVNAGSVGSDFAGTMAYGAIDPNAQFNQATGAFLGFSFPSMTGLRYGWMRVDLDNAAGTFSIRDWAYESNVNTGITTGAGTVVPEPTSLGLLALGAAGLGLYRRRQRV